MLAGGKCSGSLAVTAVTSEATPPGRPAGIHLVPSMFRCLIIRTHETMIRLLILQMRQAGFGTSRQLTHTQRGRGRLRSLQATAPGHARPAAHAVWSLSCEWFLCSFTIRETSEGDECLVMCGNCKKSEFPCPSEPFSGAGPALAVLCRLAASALRCQHRSVLTESPWPEAPAPSPFGFRWEKLPTHSLGLVSCVRWRRILFIFVSQAWQPASQRRLFQISEIAPESEQQISSPAGNPGARQTPK